MTYEPAIPPSAPTRPTPEEVAAAAVHVRSISRWWVVFLGEWSLCRWEREDWAVEDAQRTREALAAVIRRDRERDPEELAAALAREARLHRALYFETRPEGAIHVERLQAILAWFDHGRARGEAGVGDKLAGKLRDILKEHEKAGGGA